MIIRIAPTRNRTGHTLSVTRNDGSVTHTRLSMPPEHDLVHYAVESTLGLQDSFYGLIARGWNIEAFNRPGLTRIGDLPLQAIQTEFIVGLLQVELRNGVPCEDFNAELARACEGKGLEPPPPISEADLSAIRAAISDLLTRYHNSTNGVTLEFPPTTHSA